MNGEVARGGDRRPWRTKHEALVAAEVLTFLVGYELDLLQRVNRRFRDATAGSDSDYLWSVCCQQELGGRFVCSLPWRHYYIRCFSNHHFWYRTQTHQFRSVIARWAAKWTSHMVTDPSALLQSNQEEDGNGAADRPTAARERDDGQRAMLSLGPSNEAAVIDADAGSDQAVIGEQSIELRTKMDLWRVMDCFVEGEHRTGRFSAALWIHPGDGNKRLIPPPPGTFPPTRSPQNRCAKRPRVDRSAAARDAGRRYGGWRCFRWLPIVEISVKAHFDDPTDPFREADEPLSSRLAIRLSPSMEYLGITVQEDDHEGLLGEDAEGEGDGGGGSDIEIDSDVLLLTDAALEIESPPDVPAEREQSVADGRGEPVADGQQQQGQERAMVIGASDVDVPEERKGPPHTLCIQIHAADMAEVFPSPPLFLPPPPFPLRNGRGPDRLAQTCDVPEPTATMGVKEFVKGLGMYVCFEDPETKIAVSRLSCSRLPDFVTAEDDSDTDEKSDDDQAGTCDKQAVYLEAMMHPVGASRSVWWSEGEGEGDSGGDNVAEGRRRYDDEKGCQVEHQILHKDHFDLVFNPELLVHVPVYALIASFWFCWSPPQPTRRHHPPLLCFGRTAEGRLTKTSRTEHVFLFRFDAQPPDRLASPYDAPPPTADDNAEVIGEEGEGEEDDSSDLTMWSLRLHLDSSVRHGGMMRRFALSLNESHVRMMAANCGVQIGE
mmetsp:Transcript_45149/g.127438  ORF Transcript_45149/g.127438 Transcript_45149/m.127438 type:complete len:717 (+) Transcript_45149:52-2202(+)